MKKSKLIYLIFVILLCSFAYAEVTGLGVFQVNEPIDLIQICANCTYVNISSITAPNSSIIYIDLEMDKSGVRFNYTLPAQNLAGDYIVCGEGDLDGEVTVWCYDFEVTQTGYKPDTAQGLIYFILFGVSFIVFLIILAIATKTDTSTYKRDTATGDVIGINWKKYICLGASILAYACAVWIAHLGKIISENFLNSSALNSFFSTIFTVLLAFATPLVVFIITLFFVSYVTDKKNQKLIDRGLRP